MPLQLRRGTQGELAIVTLDQGEPAYITDTRRFVIGDGSTPGGNPIGGNQSLNTNSNVTFDSLTISNTATIGNIGFQGTWIRNKDTGDIYISPQDGNTGVYFPSDANADTQAVELFNVDAAGKVKIDAGSNSWAFNADGSITFPDSTVQSTAYTGGGGGSTSTFDQIQIGTGTYKLFIGESPTPFNNQFYITGNEQSNDRLFFDNFQYVQFNNTTTINNDATIIKSLYIGTGTSRVYENPDVGNRVSIFSPSDIEINGNSGSGNSNGISLYPHGKVYVDGSIDGSEGSIASMTGFRAGWYGGSSGYSFKNDGAQDTGMFSNADGDLRLRANSVDVVIIDDTQMRVDRINASQIYSNNTTQDLSLTAAYNGAGSGAGGSVNLFSAGGVQSAANVEILGDLVKVKSSDGSVEVATFDPFGITSTINSTLTIAQAIIGLNNGSRAFGNSYYPANANNMKIENPNNGGGFNFAMKNPGGVEKNVGISRQGHIILQQGGVFNGFPNGVGLTSTDGGRVALDANYDDGVTFNSGSIQINTSTGIILSVDTYDYGTDTDVYHELAFNTDGTITLPTVNQTAATNYNFDASGSNVVTVATSATVTFSNFSGDILINDLYDGFVYKFLVGSGVSMMYADTNQYARGLSKTVTVGPDSSVGIEDYVSMDFTGGSYVFTNLAAERDFSIFAVKTRNGG